MGFTFSIADIAFSLSTVGGVISISNAYRHFLCKRQPEIDLRAHYVDPPYLKTKGVIFNADGNWTLDRINNKYVLNEYLNEFGPLPYKSAVFNADWTSGDIYLGQGRARQFFIEFPLEYPFNELFFINLLPKRQGFLIHGCGIVYNNEGLIFAGASGAGKSTMSKLWKKTEKASLLNDDRLAIRYIAKKWWVYGTPWHGEVRECMPQKSPLSEIYFIKHAKKNVLKKLSSSKAVSMLLSTSFVPFWDKKAMVGLLDIYSRLVRKIPCYELGFSPNKSVVEFLRGRL